MTNALIVCALLAPFPFAADEPAAKEIDLGPAVFKAPGTWKPQRPKNMMRKNQWSTPTVEGDDVAPVVYLTELPGGGGNDEANIARWVGQYKDVSEKKEETHTIDGIRIKTLDIAGTFMESTGGPFAPGKPVDRKSYRTLAAIIRVPGSDSGFFLRMDGPAKSVAGQSEGWTKLLKSGKKRAD